ncbi:hypothetical protein BD408DRAFT_431417 [Parasitella parasitica]|nr:hypothetical protein BD408DRAFT_431417 [Parasitella parasitica]
MATASILNSLPREIIELISLDTSTQDLLQVILVSKSWYHFFYNFIYRSLAIDTSKKQERILSAFCTGKLPGHFVKALNLQGIDLTEYHTSQLTKLFPEVDTLILDWNIWSSSLQSHAHFDSDAAISFIHPPQGLPPFIDQLFSYYGSHSLRNLSINALNQESTDIWSILASCPRLKTLKLLNLNHEHIITLRYLETIHQLCPHLVDLTIKCTRSDPNPALLSQFTENQDRIVLTPTVLKSFSLASKSGSAKWPYLLPYFSAKYPHLQHVQFKHCGLGKDGGGYQVIPDQVFTSFTHGCRKLKSVRWNKIIVRHDQQKGLFSLCDQHHQKQQIQPFLHLEHIEAYENFQIPGSIRSSPLVQGDSLMSSLLTSLTIGQPPADVTTVQVLEAIRHCKNLVSLKIQECFVDPELAYDMDNILNHCRHLHTLYIKDVHLATSSSRNAIPSSHPLKKLILKRASFNEGVFDTISRACPQLDHVELLGCFQRDRRDQVRILLPRQQLTTLKIQGLRTRRYYAGCRIRFFQVNQSWYYMSQYDIRTHPVGQKLAFQKYRNMEFAHTLDRLNNRDIQELKSLVTTETLKAWDIEAVKRNLQTPNTCLDASFWDPENLYYSGFVKIEFKSAQRLLINNKLLLE